MIHLALLADTLPSFDETAMAWLLALHEEVEALGLQLLCVLVVVLDWPDAFVLSDVEVVVEISAVGTQPGEGPAHAFFVGVDLGDGRARDADEGGGARGEVLDGRDVVGKERARGTSGVPGRVEHEVVDDELAVGAEEVGDGDGRLLAGCIERSQGIWLGHFDDGEVAALGGEGVAGAGQVFFFLEQGEAGGAVLGGGDDLGVVR
jgi:hypothetical protein